jgi:hypothetical protein
MSPKKVFLKSLTRVFAFIAGCCPIGFVSAATLSPPTVDAPLYSCATTVSVSGFIPGATIKILADGATIGGGPSDSPWGQVFRVSPPLAAGAAVTATQTFGTDTSAPSQAQSVLSYAEMHENKLPTPVVSAPLYECGGALGITNLAKGGLLRVFADGTQIGQVDGCGDSQWLRVRPLLATRQKVTADEKLCSSAGSISAPVLASAPPATLSALAIGDIYEGGKYCVIDGITNGALVTTYNGSSVVDKGYYPGGGQVVRLTPPPKGGDTITATQTLCSTVSATSPGTVVQPCSSLPPPVLSPICPGDTKV